MKSSPETAKTIRRHQETKSKFASPVVLNAAGGDQKGEINLMWEPYKNARYYLLQKCSSAGKPLKWKYEDIICTSRYTVSKLKSNRSYMFRVAVMTVSGRSPWSRPVIRKAP